MIKIALGAFQFMAVPELLEKQHYHLFSAFEVLRDNPDLFAATFANLALRYNSRPGDEVSVELIEDAAEYCGGALSYTSPSNGFKDVMRALVCYSEMLATNYAVLQAQLSDQRRNEHQAVASLIQKLSRELAGQQQLVAILHEQLRSVRATPKQSVPNPPA
jgi:hypothetical protein